MGSAPRIDRVKHEADVIEHVAKGVHASYAWESRRSDVFPQAPQRFDDSPESSLRVQMLDSSSDEQLIAARRRTRE